MTCHELHTHFEKHLQPGLQLESAEIAEHIAGCTECGRFVEERTTLVENLRMVRESAPSPSPSLDDAVLISYRRHIAERKNLAEIAPKAKPFTFTALRWVTVAAALAISAILFFSSRRTVTNNAQPALRPQAASAAQIAAAEIAAKNVAKSIENAPKIQAAAPRLISSRQRHAPQSFKSAASQSATMRTPFPEEFRSLMYCDELSCAADMDVIRVQLPSSMVARPLAGFMPTSGAVTADILVGSDGIARGIRIEE